MSVESSLRSDKPASAGLSVDHEHPWLGLVSYTEETSGFFHGRTEEVAELGRRVQRKLLTVLFGQSGLGKTSILQAGLVPRLRPEGFCPVYVRLDYNPHSPPPAEQIKRAVFRATKAAGAWTQSGSAVEGESLWEFLHHRDDVLRDATGRTLTPILIFDQFEEIFTLAQTDDAGRRRAQEFLADLADLVENRPPAALEARIDRDETDAARFDFARADYRILISLREDYLAHLEGLKTQMPSVTQNRMRLARMTGAQAVSAVRSPAPHLVSEPVAAAIVRFVAGGAELTVAEVEPSLLSLICRELNNARIAHGEPEISANLLDGSRETILSEFYERTLADQPAGVRAFIEDEMLTDSGFRESVAEERVLKGFAAVHAASGALATLVDRRLLRVEDRLDQRRVEITHDVLCSVIAASRGVRRERVALEESQRQLATQQERERATRVALVRARWVASVASVLMLFALGGAIFGWINMRRAQAAETATLEAQRVTDAARTQAQDLLGYVVTDLDEQLTDMGQLPLLLAITERAVSYYEGLPESLMTPETRAARARALGNHGGVLVVQGQVGKGQESLDKALTEFGRLESDGALTPEMSIGYSMTLRNIARGVGYNQSYNDAVEFCARAQSVLVPALAAEVTRARARRELGDVLDRKGFSLMRAGRIKEAVSAYEAAIASIEESERMDPGPRPGLRVSMILPWYGGALANDNQRVKGTEANRRGAAGLREALKHEPNLLMAKRHLAVAASNIAMESNQNWRRQEARSAAEESKQMNAELLAVDPRNKIYRNNLVAASISIYFLEFFAGNFPEAAETAQWGVELLETGGDDLSLVALKSESLLRLARVHAATGDAAAMRATVEEANKAWRHSVSEMKTDSTDYVLAELTWNSSVRDIDGESLEFGKVRKGAETGVAQLDRLSAQAKDAVNIRELKLKNLYQVAESAFWTGDYKAALEARNEIAKHMTPWPEDPWVVDQFRECYLEVSFAIIEKRAGAADKGRARLDAIWPKVESVFAVIPDDPSMQQLMAYALWTRAEVLDDAPLEERGQWLARGVGYLSALKNAGRLSRSVSETLLAGMEKSLASL